MILFESFPRDPDIYTHKKVYDHALFLFKGYNTLTALKEGRDILLKVRKYHKPKSWAEKQNIEIRINKINELIYIFEYMRN